LSIKGPVLLKIRMRSATAGNADIFWTTANAPQWNSAHGVTCRLIHDFQWREYQVLLDEDQTITGLRLDPGSAGGEVEIQWIHLLRASRHPLEVRAIETSGQEVTIRLHNRDAIAREARVNGQVTCAASAAAFSVLPVDVECAGLPAIHFPVCVYNPDAKADWIQRVSGPLTLETAQDGTGAKIFRGDKLVAVLAPIVRIGDRIPALKYVEDGTAGVHFQGDQIDVQLQATDPVIKVGIHSKNEAVEGPVLRAMGSLDQGLLAGVEFLGKGEQSSSTLDIETAEHYRVTPDPLGVTMPLMACVTDRVAAAMTWKDMALQPVYATPDFLDGTKDHRMALRGKQIDAELLVAAPMPLAKVIQWAVGNAGLPAIPTPPRSPSAQRALLLEAFNKSVSGGQGWGHAAEARWERKPYADIASAIGRLTGQWPQLPALVSGGGHIRNDAAFFMSGRARSWLEERNNEAREILAQQQPDGSFHYKGPFQRGHFEDTASGYNAWRATLLLEHARLTGNPASLAGGLKCLDYMTRFRTPRGAQTYELSLHTPDLLAAAYLVWSYTRGYELTGNPNYLEQARRWAWCGLPFIYQWNRLPVQAYASIPVFGATVYREPNWIGLPVQWCGVIYGYALTMLAPHDPSFDWKHLAGGLLVAAEQMQYPAGPRAGCLPDFYLLREQRQAGPSLNPSLIVSLQWALAGKIDGLAVASNARHRIVAPFPVSIDGDVARVQGEAGAHYQVLIDNQRVVDLTSRGSDTIALQAQP
jgi:hypothetical protein